MGCAHSGLPTGSDSSRSSAERRCRFGQQRHGGRPRVDDECSDGCCVDRQGDRHRALAARPDPYRRPVDRGRAGRLDRDEDMTPAVQGDQIARGRWMPSLRLPGTCRGCTPPAGATPPGWVHRGCSLPVRQPTFPSQTWSRARCPSSRPGSVRTWPMRTGGHFRLQQPRWRTFSVPGPIGSRRSTVTTAWTTCCSVQPVGSPGRLADAGVGLPARDLAYLLGRR